MNKLGFAGVEETAIGATMVKTEYERMLHEEHRDVVISSCCHSVNLLIQKYFPKELQYLADVLSPMQTHCRDIKKRFPDAKTVFIGPCVAKKDEADYYEGIVDAVLTFEELTRWLDAEHIELKKKSDGKRQQPREILPHDRRNPQDNGAERAGLHISRYRRSGELYCRAAAISKAETFTIALSKCPRASEAASAVPSWKNITARPSRIISPCRTMPESTTSR